MTDLVLALAKLVQNTRRADNGCLEWMAGRDWDGYGAIHVEGRQYRAHRLAWQVANQAPVPPGQVIRHYCDNPPCCEPTHLVVGTVAENNADRERRGRSDNRKGERCPTAKLSWTQVRSIRALADSGLSHRAISERFPVSREAVSLIIRNERWKESA